MSRESLGRFFAAMPEGWEKSPVGRREVTKARPDAFAYVYLRHHLKGPETGDQVTYATAHDAWYRDMATWMQPLPEPRGWRHLYVAPRSSAKSTHWFLFAPLWSLANGYATFVAAFADAASQAETHLATFRRELVTNDLLRSDFPDLCSPAGTFDNRTMYQARSGAIFAARGIDAASLGMKVGERRPDVIILDDVEPGSGVYSQYQATQRRKTIADTILPLNESARTVWVGTTTMPGSLVHQALLGEEDWVAEDKWQVHHQRALFTDDDGNPASLWPAKWPVEYLLSIKGQRGFLLNFQCEPMPDDGDYWREGDITYTPADDSAPRWMLAIDPAVTDHKTSDDSALAVITQGATGLIQVRDVRMIKATGRALRAQVEALLARWPAIRVVLVETNQGGDLWPEVFHGLPVNVRTTWSSEHKPVRAARLLEEYQRRRVTHALGWDDSRLVQQMLAFPRGPNDDAIDAVGSGVRYLLGATTQKRSRLTVAAR